MTGNFNLQGHRGARGHKPENTLPSFEAALDAGVRSIETDVHLTADGVAILIHDPDLDPRIFRRLPHAAVPEPASRPLVRRLTLAQLRGYRADGNPAPQRFVDQDAAVTPLAALFAQQHGLDPYTPPTLMDLFAFAQTYATSGPSVGKSNRQVENARTVVFDLELKRVPFHPETIGDEFDGQSAGRLEQAVLQCVRAAGVVQRTAVRSFDHRCVRAMRQLEPALTGVVLVAGTAPVAPGDLARQAEATVYAPDYRFLDAAQLRHCQAAGIQVIPWTVNAPEEWRRLVDWGVEGITTDYPERLAAWLRGACAAVAAGSA